MDWSIKRFLPLPLPPLSLSLSSFVLAQIPEVLETLGIELKTLTLIMAFTTRLLSNSKQLYAAQIIFPKEHGVPVRYFAKEAASAGFKGDEMLKGIF